MGLSRRKPSEDERASASVLADRGMGRLTPRRGWQGRGGGGSIAIPTAPLWRGTSVQVCGLWPYAVGAGAPLVGAPLGKHILTGGTVCADPISWFRPGNLITAPTSTVVAREGMGKSSLVRRMAIGQSYFGIIPLVLGDLKPDYVSTIERLGGSVARIGRGVGGLNPLDMSVTAEAVALLKDSAPPTEEQARALLPMIEAGDITDAASAVEAVMVKRGQLVSELWDDARGKRHAMVAGLCEIQRKAELSDVEDTVLAAALGALDRQYDGEPVLRDVMQVIIDGADAVREAAYDEGDDARYRDTVRSLIRTLNGLLREDEGRVGSMFSQRTRVRLDMDRPACFDTSTIQANQTELVAASLMMCWGVGFNAVNTRVALGIAGVRPMVHYQVIMDEFWRVISSGAGMIDRANELTRLNRQIGAGMTMIYHTMKDLESLARESDRTKALGLIERSGLLIIGAVSPDEHPRLRRIRDFTDAELGLLTSWQDPPPWSTTNEVTAPAGMGKFMIKLGGRPGIPFQVALTGAERASRVHDTSVLWDHHLREKVA